MRLLKLTTFYPKFLEQIYRRHPALKQEPYAAQKARLDYEGFGWADFWSTALIPLGYEVMEITLNAEPLQRMWARENLPRNRQGISFEEIALEQIKRFSPEILWFEAHHPKILRRVSDDRSSIRLLMGWTGSAIPDTDGFNHYDLILSCAPESVATLRQQGFNTEHLDHGFDPRINDRLINRKPNLDLIFVGQIARQSGFHSQREQLLENLVKTCNLQIFSPSADLEILRNLKTAVKLTAYGLNRLRACVGISDAALQTMPGLKSVERFSSKPVWTVRPKLRPYLQKARFGLEMYQALADSKVTLNIHADSSPTHASNMRLFETTGVGSCLLTDWRSNLSELFEPDREVIVYRSKEDCVEKVKWLLDHPGEREALAKAGQARTLRDHTYARRAPRFHEIVESALGVKRSH